MNLLNIKQLDTSTLEVLHPTTREKTGITIEVVGADTAIHRKNKSTFFKTLSKNKDNTEATFKAGVKFLVDCTVSWKNIDEGKAKLECTPENVAKIYTNHAWIRQQVDSFLTDESNFLQVK